MNQSFVAPQWVESTPSLCLFCTESTEPALDGFGKQRPVVLGKIIQTTDGWLGIAYTSQSVEVLILTRKVKDVAKNDVENFLLDCGLLPVSQPQDVITDNTITFVTGGTIVLLAEDGKEVPNA